MCLDSLSTNSNMGCSFLMIVLRYLLLACLVFLQSGFSYYISFQVLGLLAIVLVIFSYGYVIRLSFLGIFSFVIFIFFIGYTGIISPLVISSNSTNTFLTVAALLVYSTFIFGFSFIHIKRYIKSLFFMRQLSANLILALFVFLIFSELDIIPFLNRETLALQNVGLIDNYTNIESIELSIQMDQFRPKVDLFYGESSFLAVVLLASIGCFVITGQALDRFSAKNCEASKSPLFDRIINITPFLGIAFLVYIQSLSSIMYAAMTFYFVVSSRKTHKKNLLIKWSFYAVLGIVLVSSSYEYFWYRITMENSVSFIQRFGFLFGMTWLDFIIGLKDASRLPEFGIHNGVIHLISMSGLGGLLYLFHILWRAYKTALPIGVAAYSVLLILAIFMQNGGIFTPNKIVLLALVMLPLAAVRSANLASLRVGRKN